jgi:phosphoserine phosphatase RsbU/P
MHIGPFTFGKRRPCIAWQLPVLPTHSHMLGNLMKLRWKYFIVLLVASLVPMTAVTVISHNASKKLGKSISAKTHKTLTETVRSVMVYATEDYAMITRRSKMSLEFALQVLIKEAEIALRQSLPELTRIYFAKDFEDTNSAPEDLVPSEVHMKILKDGRLLPKPISYRHPNFLLAPGVHLTDVRADVERLTRLSPTLKGIAGEFGESLFWIYASLESGVHISFPGHGGYPESYDPRLRPWYIRAQKKGVLTWGPPIVDTTTNQLTFTVSAPFFKPDGSFAGVAAIDVLVPNVLLESQISSQWSKNMKSFLVGKSSITDSGKDKLWVLSRQEMTDTVGNKAGVPKTGMVFQEEQKDFSKFVWHFKIKKSGSLEMPYQGVDSFWAFAEIFPDVHFVIVAPKSMVMELSEEVGESFSNYIRGQTIYSIAAVVIAIIVIAGIALFISRTQTRNVMSIVNGFKRLEQGDFSVRMDLQFNDERDMIVTTFNQIMPRLEEHLHMSRALYLAKEVQRSLLPSRDPTLQGFDIAGTSIYCDETGGDYYDFITIEADRLAVVVGDVSGHGVSSALLMATARAFIMLRTAMPGRPAGIINDVNKQLSLDTDYTGNFMTFFYCELTASDREVRWVRAGHDPALIYDPDTDAFDELKGHGLALGLDHTSKYEEFQHTLTPRQIVLIGTDGIWEMRNEAGDMFGKQRLMEIIRTHASATAKELLAMITDALKRFRGSKQPEDDVTMVVIKVIH